MFSFSYVISVLGFSPHQYHEKMSEKPVKFACSYNYSSSIQCSFFLVFFFVFLPVQFKIVQI